jgi:hypothetical protein
MVRWLELSRPACRLHCPYCDQTGDFPHRKSFEHANEVLSLHGCPRCGSLIYDLRHIEAPIVSSADDLSRESARAARYVLEHGFSSRYVAMCGLSAMPDVPESELGDYLFVDVGAGMGMASHFVRSVLGVRTLTIEPSFTGRLAQEILGLTVHRAYFEGLPAEVMAEMGSARCLLHLNSVVEHLADPAALLRDIIDRARVETLAIIVPDGAALDYDGPFSAALPFLAPRDHRHLPTRLGLEHLFRHLGFAYHAIQADACLLMGVGSRRPVAPPAQRTVRLGELLLLEHLLRHPHPQVREGGASRLLPFAVSTGNAPLMVELRRIFGYLHRTDHFLALVRQGSWDDIPYHLGGSCYWLAVDRFAAGAAAEALALLDVSVQFANRIAEDAPHIALTPLEYKWSALLFRAHILANTGRPVEARSALQLIIASRCDVQNGPRQMFLDEAARRLKDSVDRAEIDLLVMPEPG